MVIRGRSRNPSGFQRDRLPATSKVRDDVAAFTVALRFLPNPVPDVTCCDGYTGHDCTTWILHDTLNWPESFTWPTGAGLGRCNKRSTKPKGEQGNMT